MIDTIGILSVAPQPESAVVVTADDFRTTLINEFGIPSRKIYTIYGLRSTKSLLNCTRMMRQPLKKSPRRSGTVSQRPARHRLRSIATAVRACLAAGGNRMPTPRITVRRKQQGWNLQLPRSRSLSSRPSAHLVATLVNFRHIESPVDCVCGTMGEE